MVNRILSIDPSGTGTSGIYFKGEKEEFREIKEKEWIKHYEFISQLVKVYQPNILLFENTNFIRLRGKDMTSLLRLLGSLEVMEIEQVKSVPVDKVKKVVKELLAGSYRIKEISYQKGRGKGWMYRGKRVSIHCLEAYLVWWVFSKNC